MIATATEGVVTESARRVRALDRFFETYYRLHPVNATFTGVHDYDHLLPDWSPEGLHAARREMSALRRDLAAAGLGVLDDDSLRARDWLVVDGTLADRFLETSLLELNSAHFHRGNLSLAIAEALFGVIALMTRPFAGIEERAAAVVARLRAFPLFLVGVRRTLEDAAIPEAWRERVLRECEGGRLLLDHIEEWLIAEQAPASIHADARVALVVAQESLQWMASFVRSMRPALENRYAAGAPVLELLLRRGHWMDAPLDTLRYEARDALEEEQRRLGDVLAEAGVSSWPEARDRLTGLHPTPERLLPALEETWRACRSLAEEKALVTWPDYPIRYVPIPSWTRAAAPFLYYLYYRSPAPFDALPVVDYVVTPLDAARDDQARDAILRTWNDSAIKLNHVVHHGAIGHHVQNWYAYRAPSRVARIAAVDCACRIGMFGGGTMAEGWACYATDLMEEAGFLTPLERVAQQATRVRMATRAVVDLELHSGRLRFNDAVTLYIDPCGMSPPAARAEVVKNSMFPGTAAMYWLGTRGIHRLRSQRQRTLGTAFSLRAFHDELLSFGSIPVALASRIMAG